MHDDVVAAVDDDADDDKVEMVLEPNPERAKRTKNGQIKPVFSSVAKWARKWGNCCCYAAGAGVGQTTERPSCQAGELLSSRALTH